jgi:hypothetical protein
VFIRDDNSVDKTASIILKERGKIQELKLVREKKGIWD